MIPQVTNDELTGLSYVNMTIEHQPHATIYMPLQEYLAEEFAFDITDEDKAECIRTGHLWVIHWYPNTPVGFNCVGAPTLQRAIERAREE